MDYETVGISSTLEITTVEAQKSIDNFVEYTETKLNNLKPNIDMSFDKSLMQGLEQAFDKIKENLQSLSVTKEKALQKNEGDSDLEKLLKELQLQVNNTNVSFDNAKTKVESLEQKLKDASLTEQQKINIMKELEVAYREASNEALNYQNAMERLRDANKSDKATYVNQTQLINDLSLAYESFAIKANNAKKTVDDGVLSRSTKVDINNLSTLNKQIDIAKNEVQSYANILKDKTLSDKEQKDVMLDLANSYNKLIVLMTQKQNELATVNTKTKEGTEAWYNYQKALTSLGSELEAVKSKFANVQNNLFASNPINVGGIDSSFKANIVDLQQEIQKLIIANRDMSLSLSEKEEILDRVGSKYKELSNKYVEQISYLKKLQSSVSSDSKEYNELEKAINSTTKNLKVLDTQQERNITTMKNSIQRKREAIEKENELNNVIKDSKTLYQEYNSALHSTIASYGQIYLVLNQVTKAIDVHKEVDKALTETRKVANLTKEEMRDYQYESLETANSLGLLQTELIDATTEFVRLGLAFEEAKGFGELASIGAVVGDIGSAGEVSDFLIATIQGFSELNMEVSSAQKVIDAFNAVANNTSINFEALGEGAKRFSASMSVAGNSLEESIGLLTAGFDVTRDSAKVANGLNTISLRLRGINEEGEEQLDLVPKMESTLQAYGLTIKKVLEDGSLGMKSTYEILGEIAGIWDQLDDYGRTFLLEEIAGKRQANVASAIIGNWETVEKAIGLAVDSVGSAQNEYNIYLESMEASSAKFSNALNGLYQKIISSDDITKLIDAGTRLIEKLGEINPEVYKMIGLFTAMQGATYVAGTAFGGMAKGVSAVSETIKIFKGGVEGATKATMILKGATALGGLLPIVTTVTYGIITLVSWFNEYTSTSARLERQQESLRQKTELTNSAFTSMDSAIKNVTEALDEYGNVIMKIDEVEFYRSVNELKEIYPQLRDEINNIVSSYENQYEAMLKIQELTNAELAEEQISVMQTEQDMINELIDRRDRLSEKIQDNQAELTRAIELYPEETKLIDSMRFSIEEDNKALDEMNALLKDSDVTMQGHGATLGQLGYSYQVVNGQVQLTKLSTDDLTNSFNVQDYYMQVLLNDVIDLTTADGVLARAFIELSTTGQLSAQTLGLLAQHFDQTTISAFTSADAVIGYANANNLSTHQILNDSNSWIAGSKQKIKQHIAEMETLKQHALANEAFHLAMGNTGEAETAYRYAQQLEQNIKSAQAELKAYEALTNRLNQLKSPISGSSYTPTSNTTYPTWSGTLKNPSSSSSSSSSSAKDTIDYAKKYADQLQRISDIEAEISKLNSKLKYAKNDAERYKILNSLSGKYADKVRELERYQRSLNSELSEVKVGSDEYYKLKDMIADVEQQILDTTLAQQDFIDQIYELKKEIEEFDISKVEHEISVLDKLLDDENLTLEERIALIEKMAKLYDQQAKETKDMITLLKQEQAQYDKNSSQWRELQEEIWKYELDLMDIEKDKLDLIKDINEEILKEQEDRVNKEIELIEERLQAELDAIDEQIDALKKAKEEKEEEDKRQQIVDDINKAQSQLDSLKSDDSLWAKKQQYELQQQIKEKEKKLQELEEEKAYNQRLEELENEKKKLQEKANSDISKIREAFDSLVDGDVGIDTVINNAKNSIESALSGVSAEIVRAISARSASIDVGGVSRASTEQQSNNVFNFSFYGIDKNSGTKVSNDFISSLQSKGYKLK